MSATRPGDVPSRAVDAAEALLYDEPTPAPAAPPAPEPQAPAERRPARPGPDRARDGRFAPRGDQAPQAAPETQVPPTGQPAPTPPPAEQIDWQAIAQQREQEVARLRGSYGHNLGQKDAEIERLRKETDAARAEAERVRQETMAQYRASVEAMPEDTAQEIADKARAERALLQLERQEFETQRQQTQQQRQEDEDQRRQSAAGREDLAQRAAGWGALEGFAVLHGRQLGLDDGEIAEVVESLKTPELAAVLRSAPLDDMRAVIRERGSRLQQSLQQRSQRRLQQNRDAAIASGAHEREGGGQQPAAEPAWMAFTRERVRRPGVGAAADMVLALMDDDA